MSSSVKRALLCAACLLLLLPTSACGGSPAPAAPELLEPAGVTMDTTVVTRGAVWRTDTYEGLVLPVVRELSFSASGVMTGVNICVGSHVKAGDVLASLDVSYAAAALASQREYLAFSEQNEAVAEREQEIRIALAELALEDLRAGGADETAIRLAELQIESMENALRETRTLWEVDHADSLRSLAELEAVIDGSRLVAPCDGTVVACSAMDGGYAMENRSVLRLAEDGALLISAEGVAAADLNAADEVYAVVGGSRVEIAYPQAESAPPRAKLGSFTVADAGGAAVESGMSAVIFVISDRVEDALLVPSSAVRYDGETYVYKVVNGAQVRQIVQRGAGNDATVQILSGLEEGDVVYAGT